MTQINTQEEPNIGQAITGGQVVQPRTLPYKNSVTANHPNGAVTVHGISRSDFAEALQSRKTHQLLAHLQDYQALQVLESYLPYGYELQAETMDDQQYKDIEKFWTTGDFAPGGVANDELYRWIRLDEAKDPDQVLRDFVIIFKAVHKVNLRASSLNRLQNLGIKPLLLKLQVATTNERFGKPSTEFVQMASQQYGLYKFDLSTGKVIGVTTKLLNQLGVTQLTPQPPVKFTGIQIRQWFLDNHKAYWFKQDKKALTGHPCITSSQPCVRNVIIDDLAFPYKGEYDLVDFSAKIVSTKQSVAFFNVGASLEFCKAVNKLYASGDIDLETFNRFKYIANNFTTGTGTPEGFAKKAKGISEVTECFKHYPTVYIDTPTLITTASIEPVNVIQVLRGTPNFAQAVNEITENLLIVVKQKESTARNEYEEIYSVSRQSLDNITVSNLAQIMPTSNTGPWYFRRNGAGYTNGIKIKNSELPNMVTTIYANVDQILLRLDSGQYRNVFLLKKALQQFTRIVSKPKNEGRTTDELYTKIRSICSGSITYNCIAGLFVKCFDSQLHSFQDPVYSNTLLELASVRKMQQNLGAEAAPHQFIVEAVKRYGFYVPVFQPAEGPEVIDSILQNGAMFAFNPTNGFGHGMYQYLQDNLKEGNQFILYYADNLNLFYCHDYGDGLDWHTLSLDGKTFEGQHSAADLEYMTAQILVQTDETFRSYGLERVLQMVVDTRDPNFSLTSIDSDLERFMYSLITMIMDARSRNDVQFLDYVMPSMGLRSGDTMTTIANTVRMSMVVGKLVKSQVPFWKLYEDYLGRNKNDQEELETFVDDESLIIRNEKTKERVTNIEYVDNLYFNLQRETQTLLRIEKTQMSIIKALEAGLEAILDLLGFNLRMIQNGLVVAVLRAESITKILVSPPGTKDPDVVIDSILTMMKMQSAVQSGAWQEPYFKVAYTIYQDANRKFLTEGFDVDASRLEKIIQQAEQYDYLDTNYANLARSIARRKDSVELLRYEQAIEIFGRNQDEAFLQGEDLVVEREYKKHDIPFTKRPNDENTVMVKLQRFFDSVYERKVHLIPVNQKFYAKQLDTDIVKAMKLLSRFFMVVIGLEPSRVSDQWHNFFEVASPANHKQALATADAAAQLVMKTLFYLEQVTKTRDLHIQGPLLQSVSSLSMKGDTPDLRKTYLINYLQTECLKRLVFEAPQVKVHLDSLEDLYSKLPRAPDIDSTFVQIYEFMSNRQYQPKYDKVAEEKVDTKQLRQYHNNYIQQTSFIESFNKMKQERQEQRRQNRAPGNYKTTKWGNKKDSRVNQVSMKHADSVKFERKQADLDHIRRLNEAIPMSLQAGIQLENMQSKYEDRSFRNRINLYPCYDDFLVIKDQRDSYVVVTSPQTRRMKDNALKEQFMRQYGVYEDKILKSEWFKTAWGKFKRDIPKELRMTLFLTNDQKEAPNSKGNSEKFISDMCIKIEQLRRGVGYVDVLTNNLGTDAIKYYAEKSKKNRLALLKNIVTYVTTIATINGTNEFIKSSVLMDGVFAESLATIMEAPGNKDGNDFRFVGQQVYLLFLEGPVQDSTGRTQSPQIESFLSIIAKKNFGCTDVLPAMGLWLKSNLKVNNQQLAYCLAAFSRADPHYCMTYNRKELICKMPLDQELLDKETKEMRKAVILVCTLERASAIFSSKRSLFTEVQVKLQQTLQSRYKVDAVLDQVLPLAKNEDEKAHIRTLFKLLPPRELLEGTQQGARDQMLDLHNLLADVMRLEQHLFGANTQDSLGVFFEIRPYMILPLNTTQKWLSALQGQSDHRFVKTHYQEAVTKLSNILLEDPPGSKSSAVQLKASQRYAKTYFGKPLYKPSQQVKTLLDLVRQSIRREPTHQGFSVVYPSLIALFKGVGNYGGSKQSKTLTQSSDITAALSVLSELPDVVLAQGSVERPMTKEAYFIMMMEAVTRNEVSSPAWNSFTPTVNIPSLDTSQLFHQLVCLTDVGHLPELWLQPEMGLLAARAVNIPTDFNTPMPMKQVFKDAFAALLLPQFTFADSVQVHFQPGRLGQDKVFYQDPPMNDTILVMESFRHKDKGEGVDSSIKFTIKNLFKKRLVPAVTNADYKLLIDDYYELRDQEVIVEEMVAE